jgi:serine protease Do
VILPIVNKGVIAEVSSVQQFNQVLAKLEAGSNVTLQIKRGDSTAFITMRVGE